jgi:hypothetical protein
VHDESLDENAAGTATDGNGVEQPLAARNLVALFVSRLAD